MEAGWIFSSKLLIISVRGYQVVLRSCCKGRRSPPALRWPTRCLMFLKEDFRSKVEDRDLILYRKIGTAEGVVSWRLSRRNGLAASRVDGRVCVSSEEDH